MRKIIKRLFATIMVVLIMLTSVPLASISEFDWNMFRASALAPVKTEETTYGVLDTDVKAVKITIPEEDYTIVTHDDKIGEDYIVVKKNGFNSYLLIGTKGIVRSFDGNYSPRLTCITRYSNDFPYALYAVNNPETDKYDIYNSVTNEYFSHGFDEIPYVLANYKGYDYCKGLITFKTNSLYGLMNNRGKIIHTPIYESITPFKNCLIGYVDDGAGRRGFAILSRNGATQPPQLYKKYEDHNGTVMAVADETDYYAAVSTETLQLITDFKYEYHGGFYSTRFFTYNGKNYMLGNYGRRSENYDIIGPDDSIKNLCNAYSADSCRVEVVKDSLEAVFSNGDVRRYMILTPDGEKVLSVKDDSYDLVLSDGFVNGCEIVLDGLNSGRGTLYDTNGKIILESVVSDSLVERGKYIAFYKYIDNKYFYYVYDTVEKDFVFSDVYIYGAYYLNGAYYYSPVFIVSEYKYSGKFGIFNYETGEFSGYIFDGFETEYKDVLTNGERKAWVLTSKIEPGDRGDERSRLICIGDKFDIIFEGDLRYDSFGSSIIHTTGENGHTISDYDGKKLGEAVFKWPYTYDTEYGVSIAYDDEDYSLINDTGKYAFERDYVNNHMSLANGLAYIFVDRSWGTGYSAVIDKRGNALIYGGFEDTGYNSELGKSGTISYKKGNSVYIYDLRACIGNFAPSDSSVVTEDDLFWEYNAFLNNGFYNSISRNIEGEIINVLRGYGFTEETVAFAKSALDGQLGYVVGKLWDILPFNSSSEAKMQEELAMQCLEHMDSGAMSEVVGFISDSRDLVGKVNATQKSVYDLSSTRQKAEFVRIWKSDLFPENRLYDVLGKIEKNQKKLDAFMSFTGKSLTIIDFAITYLTIFTIQADIVDRLMRLIPSNTDLYLGLERISKQQKSPSKLAGVILEDLLTDEGLGLVADLVSGGIVEAISGKHASLVGIVLEVACMIASAAIDSPTLEDIEKTRMSLANIITLKNTVKQMQGTIKRRYEYNSTDFQENVKINYAVIYSTYMNSLRAGMEYAVSIAKNDEQKNTLQRNLDEYERRLIYRSYIKNCLLNARAQWEYTVEANKAVINKLKVEYPRGEGRIHIDVLCASYGDVEYAPAGSNVSYTIDIPDKIDGYQVSGVSAGTISGDRGITGVYVSDSVETIGTGAFEGCDNLSSVFLGNNVSRIESEAFSDCPSLDFISLPDSVENVSGDSFTGSDSIVVESSKDDVLGAFADSENISTNKKAVGISGIEIISEPTHKSLDMQGEILTDGLVVQVSFKDGSVTQITEGFYCKIPERKVGENEVIVTYAGFYDTYTVTVNESDCTYEIRYLDESGNEIRETFIGAAKAGEEITVTIPEIEGYTAVSEEYVITIGSDNHFTVEYEKNPLKSISQAEVTVKVYDISCRDEQPEATVALDGVTLKKDVDYEVEFELNKYYLTGYMLIKGIGEYCDSVIKQFELIESSHSYTKYITYLAASCMSDERRYAICDNGCGYRDYITVEGTKLPHTEVVVEGKEATCAATGLTEGKECSVCGTVIVEQKTIAQKSHSYKTSTTKATLTKNGKTETKCTVCGYTSKSTTFYYPKTITLSATSYTYDGKIKTPSVTVKDSMGTTLKKDKDYTVTYASGRKNTGKYAVTLTFKGNYSGTKTLCFNILPGKTSKITPTCATTSIKATWNKVTGANGYKVELLNSKGKVVKSVTTTKTTYTFKKLSKVTTYKVRVTAYKTIDKKAVYSKVSATITTSTAPAAATLSKVTAGSKQVTVAWKKVSSASGYEVQYSTSKNMKSAKTATVKKGTTTKTTIKKLTKGKNYYFKVRAYKTVDGKKVYGAWSAVKSVKIK